MSVAFRPDSTLCVYAVVQADLVDLVSETGVDGQVVGAVRHGKLAALVSQATRDRIRPSRANLTAHQHVVGAAHRLGPVLPVRFGTVMPGEASVLQDLLEPGQSEFEKLLDEFSGKDEYRVKCRYLPDVALREVVQSSRSIQRLRQQTASAGPGSRSPEQLRLGELVFAGLERLRHRDAVAVMEALGPHVVAWEQIEDKSDDVALHIALLVERKMAPGLEEALERIGEAQRDRLQVELIGPLPLWDFTYASPGAA